MNTTACGRAPGWLRTASLLLLPLAMTACASAEKARPAVTVVNSGCQDFRQLSWSVEDTPATSSQVRRHNRTYAELCPKGAAAE